MLNDECYYLLCLMAVVVIIVDVSSNAIGVFEDCVRQQKYLGVWIDWHRHGSGIVVTEDGLYYEGIENDVL